MKKVYKTEGTCSRLIELEVIDGKVYNVSFAGGCNGNLKGLCSLVDGMNVDMVIDKLKNIKCGNKQTSCPDQLATALIKIKKEG